MDLFVYRLLICFLLVIKYCLSFEQDFTVTIPPGKEECFYQKVVAAQIIDIEFQVIDGGRGNLDIHFSLYNPHNRALIVDLRKTEGSHRHEAKENGDYKLCFDNTFSRFSSKIVFFELIVDVADDDDDEDEDDEKDDPKVGVTPDRIYDMTIEEIEGKVTVVRSNLQKVRHMQDQIKAFEARDRNVQERNFTTVNRWSIIQLIVMVVVAGIQLIMVRSLFDEKSRAHKLWKLKKLSN